MATTFMVPRPSSGYCRRARFDLVYEPGGYRPRRGRTERRTDHRRLLTTFCYWKRLWFRNSAGEVLADNDRPIGMLRKLATGFLALFFAAQAFAWTDDELLVWISGDK